MRDATVEIKNVAISHFSPQQASYEATVTVSITTEIGEVTLHIPAHDQRGVDGAIHGALTRLKEWLAATQRGVADLQGRIPTPR